jgi:hypothetical protein
MRRRWHSAGYKTKFYVFLTAGVLLLFAAVFLSANVRFYKGGVSIAALTQRSGGVIPVHNGGIVTVLDACPPFRWAGDEPAVTISQTELPYRENGEYIVAASLEETCLRLIQAGFLFDAERGGTALASKSKICYLYWKDKTLIAQIEDLEEKK